MSPRPEYGHRYLGQEDEGREWLMTYADLVTLLMAFFVLLLAISNTDLNRFKQIISSVQYSLGVERGGVGGVKRGGSGGMSRLLDPHVKPLLRDVRLLIRTRELGAMARVLWHGNRLVIRIQGQVLFKPGEAKLQPQARPVLLAVAALAKKYPGHNMHIKGHTDSRVIKGGRFRDNWELSAVRATNVLRFLLEQGVEPYRLTATGLADTAPLVAETSPEAMAQNRRVEFVLEKAQE